MTDWREICAALRAEVEYNPNGAECIEDSQLLAAADEIERLRAERDMALRFQTVALEQRDAVIAEHGLWRTIDTAPKDGTVILLAWWGDNRAPAGAEIRPRPFWAALGFWNKVYECWHFEPLPTRPEPGDSVTLWQMLPFAEGMVSREWEPTHWAPCGDRPEERDT